MAGDGPLQPVDAVEVTVLVDNFVDMLLPPDGVGTPAAARGRRAGARRAHLRAEHGLSLLVEVERGGERETLLYDAGLGRGTALHNMDVLGVGLGDLRAVVLSHGHPDHHGGLEGMVRRVGRSGLPLLLHPDAWRERRVVFAGGCRDASPAAEPRRPRARGRRRSARSAARAC